MAAYQAANMVTVRVRAVGGAGRGDRRAGRRRRESLHGIAFSVADPAARRTPPRRGGGGRRAQGRSFRPRGGRAPRRRPLDPGRRRRPPVAFRAKADAMEAIRSLPARSPSAPASRWSSHSSERQLAALAIAWSRSRIRSCGSSIPIDSRTTFGIAPARSCCSGVSWRWVVEAE